MTDRKKTGKISRRSVLLMASTGSLVASIAPALLNTATAYSETISNITPAATLKKLTDGNQRQINEKPTFTDDPNQARILEIAKGQHPFAIVVGCSNSWIAPPIILDRGLGNIFDIQVAGNIFTIWTQAK